MITWVIGRGLLGRAVAARSHRLYEPGPVPWSAPEAAGQILRHQAREFEGTAGRGPWRVAWTAGAATTSTDEASAFTELEALRSVLEGLRGALPQGPGVFLLTSSAGGVYAGAPRPPFGPRTPPVPLSPYGELKVAQEGLTRDLLGPSCPIVIARVSNLYGPGQDLGKLQGLISRLALSAVTRQPINVFVPLDTIRDYIYVADAAQVADDLMSRVVEEQAAPELPEVIGSGEGTTVGQLISTMNHIAKRRVPVALGTHASAAAQALDLRVSPTRSIENPTPLPVGVKRVYLDILERVQRKSLTA